MHRISAAAGQWPGRKANYQKIESDSKIKDKRFCAALVWMKTMDENDSESETMDDEGIQDLLASLRILRVTKKWE